MKAKNHLLKYFVKQGGKKFVRFPDGAFYNPSSFPFAAIETSGAVLLLIYQDTVNSLKNSPR